MSRTGEKMGQKPPVRDDTRYFTQNFDIVQRVQGEPVGSCSYVGKTAFLFIVQEEFSWRRPQRALLCRSRPGPLVLNSHLKTLSSSGMNSFSTLVCYIESWSCVYYSCRTFIFWRSFSKTIFSFNCCHIMSKVYEKRQSLNIRLKK